MSSSVGDYVRPVAVNSCAHNLVVTGADEHASIPIVRILTAAMNMMSTNLQITLTAHGADSDSDAFSVEERKRRAELAKPMASAPMKYAEDGSVDWGNMWDSFCVLASAGGPAHRASPLTPDEGADPNSESYKRVQREIIRGIYLVSGLRAAPVEPGWIAVACPVRGMAAWVAEQAVQENVPCRFDARHFFVPCGENWTTSDEIKSVITVVAKTTHYWADHVSSDIKGMLAVEASLHHIRSVINRLLSRD